MDWQLVQTLGTKALMAGAGALLLYWTISAVKLVLNARDRKSTRLNSSHVSESRMPSSA